MFLPTTQRELRDLEWKKLDIILITGDAYIDSPHMGVAIIGNLLINSGYKVGVIAQPDINSGEDIMRLGEPRLFWGITAGSIDSMVANYTALKKRRKNDDFTPDGQNSKRPDRATIAYCNLIRRYFKNTRPLVIGGIEASMRRIAHYDYWDDDIRRSLLFDSKADILVYGMGEKAVLEIARTLKQGSGIENIRGTCYIAKIPKDGYIVLPSYEEARRDKAKFTRMFEIFYANTDPITANGLCQLHDSRYLIQNPPACHLSEKEIDSIYEMPFEREVHPFHKKQGEVRAMDTIKFSITSHRGCYGECNFCSIAVHQGRTVCSRSASSILSEAAALTRMKVFKGNVSDLGGPTANMYKIECEKKLSKGSCSNKRCLYPDRCSSLKIDHKNQRELLRLMRNIPGINKVFIASGIRYDMITEDTASGSSYLRDIVEYHISGQLKIAPEHSEDYLLKLMGKPKIGYIKDFKKLFDNLNKQTGKKQFLTYYLIAAHPGCDEQSMKSLKAFTSQELKINPEQVQIFTPLPSTYSALMYYTERDPFTGKSLFVEKNLKNKERQKQIVVAVPGKKKKFRPH